ncbi:MAG: zinc-binding dehydrogenase [Gemmataceae bacterium]
MPSLAAIFEGTPGQLHLREFATPRPQVGEILVRVLGCTICGSDRHTVEGRRTVPVPTVLGHEIVGEVVTLGPEAAANDLRGQPLRPGDRITWAIVASCGTCRFCLSDLPQKCTRAVKYGHEKLHPGQELRGGLAQHCLLAPGTAVVALPESLPLATACPASCATATVAAAIEAAGSLRGAVVGVFGAGMLGLTACAMASLQGPAAVFCIDPDPSRRQQALAFGATQVVDPSSVPEPVLAAGGFDVVLELSGQPTAFQTAWPLLRPGGLLLLVGSVYPTPPVSLELEQVVRRCITLRGLHNYAPRHLVQAVEFLEAHHQRFPFESLVGTWFDLASCAQVFHPGTGATAFRVGVRPG